VVDLDADASPLGGVAETPEPASPAAWLAILAAYLLVPIILIGVGRDLGWWQAWAFSLVVHVSGIGGRVWADRRHPGLQADRMKFGRGQQVRPWDKLLAVSMVLTVLYVPVLVAALDHANAWTAPLPILANLVGLLLCVVGYGVTVWALVENRFFTSLVRIQTERGHEVCDSGPYRLIRHPGYAGNLLGVVGIPLLLDSAWAWLAAGLALASTLLRTALEDRMLMEDLPGYRAYAGRVRSRLFPGIW
jgi:protein-S-isoprenylcysteine O-methyltransferase Ste14